MEFDTKVGPEVRVNAFPLPSVNRSTRLNEVILTFPVLATVIV